MMNKVRECLSDMGDFAKNACASYENLSGCTLKAANTPYLSDGSLVTSDFEVKGTMAADASKIFMKILWSARLWRPDLMKGISDLTRKITTWSRADDRKLFCLMCYLKGTANHVLEGYIDDKPEALKLNLYTDADHASGVEDVKSTSGMYLTLEGVGDRSVKEPLPVVLVRRRSSALIQDFLERTTNAGLVRDHIG